MKIVRQAPRVVKPQRPSSLEAIVDGLIRLSSSDLVVGRGNVEILYIFEAATSDSVFPPTEVLEESLSEILSVYPAFAGRLVSTTSPITPEGAGAVRRREVPAILLNDEGAALVEAVADGPLDELRPFHPSPSLLDLVPVNRGAPELFLVQITRFTCGGVVVGLATHHQVADGESAFGFMNAWGLKARGLPVNVTPIHDRSILMPRDPPQPMFKHIEYERASSIDIENYGISSSRLHFSVELLKQIKEEALKGAPEGVTYSTFVSLLAHLWRCTSKAREIDLDYKNVEVETRATIALSVRKRINPPIPTNFFGNVVGHACSKVSIKKLIDEPLSFAASLINESIKDVNDEYVRSALDFIEIQQRNIVEFTWAKKRLVMYPNLRVTSWVGLPLHNLDFGVGKPIFVGNPLIPIEGLVIIVPSPKGDGSVDVSLGLYDPHMEKLNSICFQVGV